MHRRDGAKMLNDGREALDRVVDVFFSRESPEAEANRRRRHGRVAEQRPQDVRWRRRRGTARRARRHRDVADPDEQRIASSTPSKLNCCAVPVVREPVLERSVDDDPVEPPVQYAEALELTVRDEHDKPVVPTMGSYGVGVTRAPGRHR